MSQAVVVVPAVVSGPEPDLEPDLDGDADVLVRLLYVDIEAY